MSQKRDKGNRSAGVLLHPTSLPGPYGIGDLGPAGYAWVDSLVRARQSWWQVLPLGPTGYGDSPYQSFCTFAGNPYLVSPDLLVQDGLLKRSDLEGVSFSYEHVDYGPVIQFKIHLLEHAWDGFQSGAAPGLKGEFDTFAGQEAAWLEDYALFMALKDAHGGASWLQWEPELVVRQPAALAQARQKLAGAVNLQKFRQFLFFRQWRTLKRYANEKKLKLIGDIPIFVSSDSVDVWANPALFFLDERRRPTVMAGVPPDYFSATGQLWGNPLYHWDALRQTGYDWWVKRVQATLKLVDLIRLDHFRGFEAYWEVPGGRSTAQDGRWVKGPGMDLFQTLRSKLGGLPFIAEDLGLITDEVEALRIQTGLMGMRVLQFAFGGATEDRFLPHNFERHTVVYTGTHDNETTVGWYRSIQEHERRFLHRYLGRDGHDVAWDLMRLAWSSVADYALAPLQDVLSLGTEARMNFPGRPSGNWAWRYKAEMLTPALLDRLADMTDVYWR
ncbi:MAG TPA: 4-alpha-glucanotransferase [Gemmataceae bacterium]|jgi:4-alpha-glucanotransferase|nr:4-alpha-glucanotransferase [Gemmataceae bacterium]